MKRDWTDAEFEVVSDARALPGPKARKSFDPRWAYYGFIIAIAGFTLLIGLAGGLEPVGPDQLTAKTAFERPAARDVPEDVLAVEPVRSAR